MCFFFFKQKTAYEMRISDWSSDVCSSDLLGRSGLSSGSIALHDQGVPLRLAGLGTRRLATLALQKSAIREGAILLVDEIEHGLEPHRLIGAIAHLKADPVKATNEHKHLSQVLITQHSDESGQATSRGKECQRG